MSKARDLAGIFNLGPRSGTTAQRPSTAEVGDIFYNGTTGKTEIYTTTGWQEMSSGIPFGNTAGRPTAVTGQPYFNGEEKRLEIYTSAGWQNIVSETPGVVSVSGNYLESAGSGTLEVTGTNFTTGAIASVIGTNGVEINATSTTVNSIVSVTAVFTGLVSANEPYDLKVTNTSNLFGLLPDAVYVNNILNWQTASGSLGSFGEQVAVSVSAIAVDDSTLTYSLASGSTLPSGVTLNSATGVISGTLPDIAANTTYTFTINASDGSNPAVPRAFSITSNAAPVWVTSSGSLGTFNEQVSVNLSVNATDAETVSYALASGSSLPSGLSLNSSTGVISGTLPDIATTTTYTFTINASDALNTVSRQFSITSNPTVGIEYLVVAGGGGGGGAVRGGGGGAGGYRSSVIGEFSGRNSSAESLLYKAVGNQFTVTVGNGGASGPYNADNGAAAGEPGSNSILDSIISIGGGNGGASDSQGAGRNPGSGGSGGGGFYGWQGQPGAAGTVGQGFEGGTSLTSYSYGGGGGGAGGAGFAAQASGVANGSKGGPGLQSSITGTATYYAGGGSSAGYPGQGSTENVAGGIGGGGTGMNNFNRTSGQAPANGTANTGGGGGASGNGGSGIVVIAYPNTFPALTTIPGTLTYDQPTRAGYRVYRFTAGTGTVTF